MFCFRHYPYSSSCLISFAYLINIPTHSHTHTDICEKRTGDEIEREWWRDEKSSFQTYRRQALLNTSITISTIFHYFPLFRALMTTFSPAAEKRQPTHSPILNEKIAISHTGLFDWDFLCKCDGRTESNFAQCTYRYV